MSGEPDDIRTVMLPAELTWANVGEVRDLLARALDGATVLVADMTATTYCALEGLAVLLAAHAAAAAAGAQLWLASPGPVVRQLLARTGASQIL